MRSCALALIWLPWLLGLLAGCEQSHRLGGPLDAAVEDAEPWVPDESLLTPIFPAPGGTFEDWRELRMAMAGDWWGATSYDEQTSELFEVHFDADGTYTTRCLIDPPCEPFGVGTDGDNGFRWEVFTLDEDGNGHGEVHGRLVVLPVVMQMLNVRYRPERELLSFVLTGVLHSDGLAPSVATVAQVALRRGRFEQSDAYDGMAAP